MAEEALLPLLPQQHHANENTSLAHGAVSGIKMQQPYVVGVFMSEQEMLPLSFRSELLQHIMPALQGGECCSLIGTSGIGKTNLVRFLQRPDVQAHYWGNKQMWVIFIDTHGMVFGSHSEEYVLEELMIHRLIQEAERRKLPDDLIADFDRLHAGLIAQANAHLALRYLERICGRLCRDHHIQIVFAFDQFEDIWKSLDERLFLNLRYLRDEYKYQIVYLVMTREHLRRIREHQQSAEAFWELFSAHTYGLGMYTEHDAHVMIDRIARRHAITVPETIRHSVLMLSGRHPALLRAVFWTWYNAGAPTIEIDDLLGSEMVVEECAKLWNDLLPQEQQIVRGIASSVRPHTPDDAALAELRLKEVIVDNPPSLFSPLFAAFVNRQGNTSQAGILLDTALRQVWVDGQILAEPLAPLEFSLLEHLVRNAGKVCKREDLLSTLYRKEALDANDERLDTVLRRLRETLGEDARNPRHIFTHRGVGIRLAQGTIRE